MSTTIDQLDLDRFNEETRDFASQCFARFERANRRNLIGAPRADAEALNLIRTGLPIAIRDAENAGNIPLAHHFRAIMERAPKKHTVDWLVDLLGGVVS